MKLLVLTVLSSFSNLSAQTMDSTKSLRMLALGDSYTIGESVPESERWPVQLADTLRKHNIPVADPLIIARTGWTTDELNTAIDKAKPEGTFDLVTLLIGVNNQYRERTAEEYRGEFVALLKRAIGFADNKPSRVIVVSIPDWGVMPFAKDRDRKKIANEIDAFNSINWEESVRAGVAYVDITPISREVDRYPELIASDGLHPSGAQYTAWVETIRPKALKALGFAIEKGKK